MTLYTIIANYLIEHNYPVTFYSDLDSYIDHDTFYFHHNHQRFNFHIGETAVHCCSLDYRHKELQPRQLTIDINDPNSLPTLLHFINT